MRWYFTVWNKRGRDIRICLQTGNQCYVVDKMGNRCDSLTNSERGNNAQLTDGQKKTFWIDFQEPIPDGGTLTARFPSGVNGEVIPTLIVNLNGPNGKPIVKQTLNLAGRWNGAFQVPGQGDFPVFLTLTQNGNELTGSATTTDPRTKMVTNVTMDLKATVDHLTFKFEETRITKSLGKANWSLKSGTLTASIISGTTELSGTWQSSGSKGQVKLRKQ